MERIPKKCLKYLLLKIVRIYFLHRRYWQCINANGLNIRIFCFVFVTHLINYYFLFFFLYFAPFINPSNQVNVIVLFKILLLLLVGSTYHNSSALLRMLVCSPSTKKMTVITRSHSLVQKILSFHFLNKIHHNVNCKTNRWLFTAFLNQISLEQTLTMQFVKTIILSLVINVFCR